MATRRVGAGEGMELLRGAAARGSKGYRVPEDLSGMGVEVAMSGLVVATLPLPPSANAMYRCVPAGRGRARTIKSKAGRDYEALCARLMDAHVERARGEVPGEGPLRADVTLYVPDRRKRDRDNMLKALMDVVSRNLGFDDARVWGGETRKRIDRRRPRAEVLIGREDV